jgi:hypothetical protein
VRHAAALLALALALPACCRAGAASRPYTAAELAAAERDELDRAGGGYSSAIVAPFVVVGDGPPEAVSAIAAQSVAWARDLLKRDFFERDPGRILSIWLFRDESSYRSGTSAIFGMRPDTPYGFYAPCKHALVMNIGLGYGTLVHEMVHAYMDANFHDAPVWVNEGLGSLFEAPSCAPAGTDEAEQLACAKTGHLRGRVNWRLPALQEALKSGRAPTWERMASAGRFAFDGKEGPLLYATARYVLYWLQEKGVLVRWFHAFRASAARDSEGLAILREQMGGRPLPELRREWEAFVADLRYVR